MKESAIFNIAEQAHRDPETQKKQALALAALVSQAHTLFEQYRISRPDSILWTPVLYSTWLSSGLTKVYIKLETEQLTNSFKVRGAFNRVHAAIQDGATSVVTASTGNHAMAVTHALKMTGASGVVYLPKNAKAGKVHALRSFMEGSNVRLRFEGDDCLQAELAAAKYSQEDSAVYISPYNDLLIMAGQGTIGVEIADYLSKINADTNATDGIKCCYVTVGGGGLIAGIAAYLKGHDARSWRIVACLPHNSPVMYDCLKAGKVVDSNCLPTLSDGSAGDIEQDSLTVDVCRNLVDAWALINEADIAKAIRGMFCQHRKVVEGAAAVAVAGFQIDRVWREENLCSTAVIVACGANIDTDTFASIISDTDNS